MRSRALLIGIGIAVSALLLYLTFRRVELDSLFDELASMDVRHLLAAIAVKGAMILVVAARTRVLIARLGRFRYWTLVKGHLLAHAVNNVMPLRAGELARVGYLADRGGAALTSCLAVVLTERLVEVFAFCLLLAAVLPTIVVDVPLGASFYLVVAGALAAVSFAVLVSHRPRLFVALVVRVSRLAGDRTARWVELRAHTFADGLAALQRVSAVAIVVGLSLLFWGMSSLNVFLVASALGIQLPWYGCFVVLAFIALGLAVPSTPGNIGTFHFFAAAAITALGFDRGQAISFAIVAHAVAVVPYTLVSVPLLASDYLVRRSAGG